MENTLKNWNMEIRLMSACFLIGLACLLLILVTPWYFILNEQIYSIPQMFGLIGMYIVIGITGGICLFMAIAIFEEVEKEERRNANKDNQHQED